MAVYFNFTTFDAVWEKLDDRGNPYKVAMEEEEPVFVRQKFLDLESCKMDCDDLENCLKMYGIKENVKADNIYRLDNPTEKIFRNTCMAI